MSAGFATKLIAVLGIAIIGTNTVSAQAITPHLELRTSEELILDPGQQVVLTLMVVDASEKNSISLKLNTIGGVQIKDITLLNTYIYVNKQISSTGAVVDLAKTDLFTNEDIVGTVTVEMTGLADGSVIISRESLIDQEQVGTEFKMDIKYSGVTPIGSHSANASVFTVISKAIDDLGGIVARQFGISKDLALVGLGLGLLAVLVLVFRILQLRDRRPKVTKSDPPTPITPNDLQIGGALALTPIPANPAVSPISESPGQSQTVALPN